MRLIKEFRAAFVMPSDDEIREAIELAKNDNCIVRIGFFTPYFGYRYIDIEPESTFQECYNRIHLTKWQSG